MAAILDPGGSWRHRDVQTPEWAIEESRIGFFYTDGFIAYFNNDSYDTQLVREEVAMVIGKTEADLLSTFYVKREFDPDAQTKIIVEAWGLYSLPFNNTQVFRII